MVTQINCAFWQILILDLKSSGSFSFSFSFFLISFSFLKEILHILKVKDLNDAK